MLQQAQPPVAPRRICTATNQGRRDSRPARFCTIADDVGAVVVGVFGGKPVYLRDVAGSSTGRRSRPATCCSASTAERSEEAGR